MFSKRSILYIPNGVNYALRSLIFLVKSTRSGVATNIDEYVPTNIPIIKAKINPLIAAPPKIKMINSTTKVVIEVLIVLDKVAFKAPLISDLKSASFSRKILTNPIKYNNCIIDGISYNR